MPRPISFANTPPMVFLVVFVMVWAFWCVFAVQTLVPLVERHVVIYYGLAAWVLCMLPVLAVAIFTIVFLMGDEQES